MSGVADQKIEERLVALFRETSELRPGISDEALLQADYFAAGYIDSFGIINLIAAIETAFAIRFLETDFQDRRFAKLDGIAAIIVEKLDG